ncbi:hypothetical protein [Olsenella uli]|uniref:hypothetical protein n=1 Tax=Olsenella uli TaxID=133926 RepID=UPI0028EBBA7E|nr:hypothetical protein [Olsenella uli]
MARVTTLPELLWPLMDGMSLTLDRCAVCGKPWPLNQHHVVRRGAGRLYRGGVEVSKPTVTLCGSGNASGCHGLAHANRLHFRWAGRWEYLLCDEPTRYQEALEMDGWRAIRTGWED